jgi:hypothetical protein
MFFSKRSLVLSKFLIFTFLFSFTGCFDEPKEFVGPTWETKINIPLTKKEFSLLEIVEKDSSFLSASQDPSTLGQIYYADTQSISTIKLEDELIIDSFETNFAQTIGPIKVSVPIPAASEIRVEDWTTDVTSGAYQVFPEQEGNVNIEVNGIETVQSISAESGNLTVFIWNNLPVPIVLRGMEIHNIERVNPEPILKISESNQSDWIIIPPNLFWTDTFPVDGKIITNSLEYIGTIWSGGSNGDSVQVPEEAGTTVLALFDSLVISEATAALPEQSFQFAKTLRISDSTKIEEALISEGRAFLITNNNMDVSLTASVTFSNLFNSNEQPYSLNIPLAKLEKNKIVEIPSLTNWKIVSLSPGVPTNEIGYSVSVLTDSTGEVSTITKDDSISFNLNFDELVFESFKGQLKPINVDIERSGFKLDYGSFKEQLYFQKVNFDDAKFNISFKSSANLDILAQGEIFATNGIEDRIIETGDLLIPSYGPTTIELNSLLNGFTSALPDSFSLDGRAILNPNYEIGEVKRGDSLFGQIDFEIPLIVGMTQGTFRDTFDLDLGDIDEDDIDNFNYGSVTFTIKNNVPVGINFTAEVLDSNSLIMLPLPTSYNNLDNVKIPKPSVSDEGEVISAGISVQTLTLIGDDIKTLLNSPLMSIEVNFGTADGDSPVKFKTSNTISFEIRAEAEYKVEL